MDNLQLNTIKHAANAEAIRRLLIKYFLEKGFSNFAHERVYPALLNDLPYVIPILGSKVEIIPFAKDIDNVLGKATLGWNLFVLGDFRMSLGNTIHRDLMDLSRQIRSGTFSVPSNASQQCTNACVPRQIITFIVRILGEHEDGYVDLVPSARGLRMPGEIIQNKNILMGQPQQYFTKSGYGT
jgi:hypothetical protein